MDLKDASFSSFLILSRKLATAPNFAGVTGGNLRFSLPFVGRTKCVKEVCKTRRGLDTLGSDVESFDLLKGFSQLGCLPKKRRRDEAAPLFGLDFTFEDIFILVREVLS
mmetsp:Transcript_7476/g.10382  ORF Transcript_7476/g.10382 Transcript_7476/m.10382 type:complete len:109 (-) Transcript_7476:44-370(-)